MSTNGPLSESRSLYNDSVAAHRRGEFEEALRLIKSAIELDPRQPSYHYLMGLVFHDLKDYESAAQSYRNSIALFPKLHQAWNNLALVLQALNRDDEARQALESAIRFNPRSILAYNNLGQLLRKSGNHAGAKKCFEAAIHLAPSDAYSHFNLGVLQAGSNDIDAAIVSFENAVKHDETDAQAWRRLGECLVKVGLHEKAMTAYARACALQPENFSFAIACNLTLPVIYESSSHLDLSRNRYEAGLSKLEKLADDLLENSALIRARDLEHVNFFLAYQGKNDVSLQQRYARVIERLHAHAEGVPRGCARNSIKHSRRLRIGFVSRFFWRSTVGSYFKSWVTRLDRELFDVFVYALDSRFDQLTQELASCSHFKCLDGANGEIGSEILKDDLDVLIYPEIGMDGKTFLLASQRLAPVQCVAWGHPVTTGLSNIDYYFTSSAMEPANHASHYSETPILLDGIGTCYERPAATFQAIRQNYNLPEKRNLYLVPQSLFKIHPDCDELFADVLRKDDNATLVFFETRHRNIRERFLKRMFGVIEERCGLVRDESVIILPYMPHQDYLAVNAVCDVMLDTLHWSGGNTTLDAIAVGLPVVTMPGEFMRGRQTMGMLKIAGVNDLILNSDDEYVDLAVNLAKDKDLNESYRARLTAGASLLFDQEGAISSLQNNLLAVTQGALT